MKERFLGLIAAVLFAGPLCGAAFAAELRVHPRVVVEGDIGTLADLFDGAGSAGGTVVAQAPAPGQRMAITPSRIWKLARANGLEWTPPIGLDRVIVRRASRQVPEVQIQARIRDALADSTGIDSLRVDFANHNAELHVAVGAPGTLEVETIDFDARTGNFAANLIAAPGTPDAVRVSFTGRAVEVVELPVLSRRHKRGEIIGEGDIEWIERQVDRLPQGAITEIADLVGQALRRSIRPRQPVRANDVHAPIVVAKGAMVVLVYRTASMVLTAGGRALDDGAQDAVIRFLNTHSKIVLEARVDGGNVVSVARSPIFATN